MQNCAGVKSTSSSFSPTRRQKVRMKAMGCEGCRPRQDFQVGELDPLGTAGETPALLLPTAFCLLPTFL
jgi:hypothetical protein